MLVFVRQQGGGHGQHIHFNVNVMCATLRMCDGMYRPDCSITLLQEYTLHAPLTRAHLPYTLYISLLLASVLLVGHIACIVTHLEVCQRALAWSTYVFPHGRPQRQVHEPMDCIVDGVHDERDSCITRSMKLSLVVIALRS